MAKPEYPQALRELISEGKSFSKNASLYGIDLTALSHSDLCALLAVALSGHAARLADTAKNLEQKYLDS